MLTNPEAYQAEIKRLTEINAGLVAALEGVTEQLADWADNSESDQCDKDAVAKARATLAKARET